MLFNRLYYQFKPLVPPSLRIGLRRFLAKGKRKRHRDVWPINPASATPPPGWNGWPDGKQFALVLTHDIEGSPGLRRCHKLMELEESLGFRSSFNFIPEGEYAVSKELRDSLTANGFEVGVHDLRHDGKLYWSREVFRSGACRINRYLKEWNAVGFRSGFMHHKLDWLHDLDIEYDMSTFDTDPFEPQPDPVSTIFPFWVQGPGGRGYVEMPYTLPQDFTLFAILREPGIDTWKRKLDWIAEHGGMALLDLHPDYVSFSGTKPSSKKLPAAYYRQFLEYVRSKYQDRYWHVLPKDVARFVRESHKIASNGYGSHRPACKQVAKRKVWIDLDNTPHVPFFKPIIRELEGRGYEVVLTGREAFQVCELATRHGLTFTRIGHHYGKNPIMKLWGLLCRAFQLLPFAVREKPFVGLSHGARSQMLICNLLRIPTILILDYEHAKSPPLARPQWEIVPEAIPTDTLYCRNERVRKYPGIKEDVYAPEFKPDSSILEQLGLSGQDLIVTVRPPATEAHYHNPESELLFSCFMDRVCGVEGVRAVLLPRNKKQEAELKRLCPRWFSNSKVIVPDAVVDGLNLLWHSDLVVSGGGTMNREAAALGVPVYSIFRGKTGAVDRQLQKEGRLILINSTEDIRLKIALTRRQKVPAVNGHPRTALQEIVRHIEEIIHWH